MDFDFGLEIIDGLAALFSTCLDCFDIVVTCDCFEIAGKARDLTLEFQELCADLDLQRLRFCLWGESLGLASRDRVEQSTYHAGLTDPIVNSTLSHALRAIMLLLKQAGEEREYSETKDSALKSLQIFRDTFTRLRYSHQVSGKQTLRKAMWWTVQAGDHFPDQINLLSSLIDCLESITIPLRRVQGIQQSRLREEIQSLNDVNDLHLIKTILEHSQPDVSDTASRRILMIENASISDTHPVSNTESRTADKSFHTAENILNDVVDIFDIIIDFSPVPQHQGVLPHLDLKSGMSPQWRTDDEINEYGSTLERFDVATLANANTYSETFAYLGQAISQTKGGRPSEGLSSLPIKRRLIERRIFRELQDFENIDSTRWITAAPVKSDIFHILAGIEGPPNTPFEKGVFWLDVHFPLDYPHHPMEITFITRIYHPNIDSRGNICLGLLGKAWCPVGTLSMALMSICSLLDTPSLDDPLVPEIAQIYREDYALYYQNARSCTRRYASFSPGAEFARCNT